jgi:CheY-like chemotaxis protein
MLDFNKFTGNDPFVCGDLNIRPTSIIKNIEKGQTVKGISCSGLQKLFEVEGNGVKLDLAYTTWETGERDIRTAYKVNGPAALRRLQGGRLRLPIMPIDNEGSDQKKLDYVILRQARVKIDTTDKWSNLFKAGWEDLDDGSRLDSIEILKQAKTLHLGTKQELLGVNDRSRLFLCAIFERNNELFPVVAFVLTRVLPLINEYPASKRNHFGNKEKEKSYERKVHTAQNKNTILIVDDELSICRVLKEFLNSKGFVAFTAAIVEEAIEILDENDVDLVITNLRMPGMDGIEFTKLIKEKYDSDVIITTGYHSYTFDEAVRLGAVDLLYKPVKLVDLLNSVNRILEKPSRKMLKTIKNQVHMRIWNPV